MASVGVKGLLSVDIALHNVTSWPRYHARLRWLAWSSHSADDEAGQVDHARTGVDVDGPVSDAERRENDREHDARVSVDGVRTTHVRVLSSRRCRRCGRRLGLDSMLFAVGLCGYLLLLLLLV